MKRILLFTFTTFFLFSSLTTVVTAQKGGVGGGGGGTPAQDTPLGGGNCGGEELNTAIGCIPISDWNSIVSQIIKVALGVAGGVAFALILVAGFMIMTSQGDPKRLGAGQELLTSAVMGLILLIFSVYLLTIIGVKILEIPGLT